MKYQSGEEILVGDEVLIEYGKTPGVIDTIIETQEEMKEWGVEQIGVLIKSEPFGLVFWSILNNDDPVIFNKRKNT